MKRLFFILLIVFFSIPALVDAQTPHRVKAAQMLYDLYDSRTDLTVAKVEGFKLNDSVKVDVVIVVADNANAWKQLCKEFDIRSQKGVTTWTGKLNKPETRIKWDGKSCCKAIASPSKKTVCFYLLNNSLQYESLMDYQMNLMMNK